MNFATNSDRKPNLTKRFSVLRTQESGSMEMRQMKRKYLRAAPFSELEPRAIRDQTAEEAAQKNARQMELAHARERTRGQ